MAIRRRIRTVEPDEINDEIADVIEQDNSKSSEELASTLDELRGLQGSAINIIVYKIDRMRGKWQYVKEVQPPVDTVELMEELRRDWGAANYGLRIMVNGKLSTTKHISIAEPKPGDKKPDNSTDMIQLMLNQADRSRTDQSQMFQLMMTMMQQSSQQAMAAQQNSTQMMLGVITAMMGNKESAGTLLTQLIAAQQAMKPDGGNNIKDTLEILTAVKDMLPSSDGGGDLFSNVLKAAPGVIEAVSKLPMALPNPNNGQGLTFNSQIAQHAGATAPPMDLSQLAGRDTLLPPDATQTPSKSHPVLDLIREDLIFHARRKTDVELAGECILNVLEEHGITADDVLPLATEFQSSPNWLDNLAGYGIDLRSVPIWANQLLSLIVQSILQPEPDGNSPVGDREGGSETDASVNGVAGTTG